MFVKIDDNLIINTDTLNKVEIYDTEETFRDGVKTVWYVHLEMNGVGSAYPFETEDEAREFYGKIYDKLQWVNEWGKK